MLTTARLVLRPWRVSDAPLQRALWEERDPRVPPHRRIDVDGHPTVAELEQRARVDVPPPGLGLLAVEDRTSGEFFGYCGLIQNAKGPPDEPEVAYEFLQRVWGRGYATESGEAVIRWARDYGHRRLWATVRAWNVASRRVLARLDFVETDRVETDELYGDNLFATRAL
jgi:RimJ/RimL family protein N-acetyltransferase